jgi:cellulose synthase operon protein C
MRIVCQKCSSAYAIDDKVVTAKGVRAQCPRCRHLQLVKKDEVPVPASRSAVPPLPSVDAQALVAAPAVEPAPSVGSSPRPPAQTPFLFEAEAPSLPPSPLGPTGQPVPPTPMPFAFDFGALPSGAGGPTRAANVNGQSPAAAFGGLPAPRFDFEALPPAPATERAAAFDFGDTGVLGPSARPPIREPDPALLDFVSASSPASLGGRTTIAYPTPIARSEPTALLDFGAPPPDGESATVAIGAVCSSCGKTLSDPFDQALGTCDGCRARLASDPAPGDSTGPKIEEVPTAEIHAGLAGSPAPRPSSKARPAPAPVSAEQIFGPPPAGPDLSGVRSAARAGSMAAPGRTVALIIGLAAAVGVSVYLAIKRPWARKGPPLVAKREAGPPRRVEGIVQQWRLNYPELAREPAAKAKEYVDEGEALLAKDTTGACRDAEEAFRKALILDPASDRAVAGWVLALVFGRDARLEDTLAKSAEAMLIAAEQRSGDPRVYVAHAHLLISRGGNQNDIRVLAERGANSPNFSDRALSALAVGQTLLTNNPQQAAAAFRQSLTLDPNLKRGYLAQSQLAISLGHYKEAIDHLEHRLELDKDQWEAAEALARLWVDVGELARARRVLEAARDAAPTTGRARLVLAMLEYQHLGESTRAEGELVALAATAELPAHERADAWVHLAIVRRLAGDGGRAMEAADRALELSPGLPPARLQKLLVLLDRGVPSAARVEFEGIKGNLEDRALEATLEGRLLIAENRLDDATRLLSETTGPGRRADALLLAGAAAAKAHKDGKAWELCLKEGLKVDPRARSLPTLTHFYVRPADLLRGTAGAYRQLAAGDDDPNPALCEGLLAWFSDDLQTADRLFAKVIAIDPQSADAYAYRALGAMARKDLVTAGRLAARGLDSSRTNALAAAVQGLIFLQTNRIDAAKGSAAAALKYNPGSLMARTVLGDAAARMKDREEAMNVLTTVLLSDPLYRDAKRVLYKQQL